MEGLRVAGCEKFDVPWRMDTVKVGGEAMFGDVALQNPGSLA